MLRRQAIEEDEIAFAALYDLEFAGPVLQRSCAASRRAA
jgi:hypothetical protein